MNENVTEASHEHCELSKILKTVKIIGQSADNNHILSIVLGLQHLELDTGSTWSSCNSWSPQRKHHILPQQPHFQVVIRQCRSVQELKQRLLVLTRGHVDDAQRVQLMHVCVGRRRNHTTSFSASRLVSKERTMRHFQL